MVFLIFLREEIETEFFFPWNFSCRTGEVMHRYFLHRRPSILCDAVDFGQTGDALLDLEQGRCAQIPYAGCASGRGDIEHVAALENDLRDRLVDRHYLVDAGSALVALVAHRAPDGVVNLQLGDVLPGETFGDQGFRRKGQRLLALVQASRKTLGDDEGQRRGDVVRGDAHIHQSRYRLRRVVGVQGRQDHVTRLRSLDRDL